MKKIVNIIGIILFSFTIISYPVFAFNDYPYLNSCTEFTSSCVDPWGFYNRQCTSYVAWRMNRDAETTTEPYSFHNYMLAKNNQFEPNRWSNAGHWAEHAQDLGIEVNNTPFVGSVAHWGYNEVNGGFGHVAYVESINSDGSVNLSEYNYSLPYNYGTRNHIRAPRYIHVNESSNSITVYDFWKIADPIYADPDADIWHPNFDAQYKIRNDGSEAISIQRLALAIHRSDNAVWFDMSNPSTGQARYYENFTLNPGESYHFDFSVAYFTSPGTFKVVAKAQMMDGTSNQLASMDFVVQETQTSTEFGFAKVSQMPSVLPNPVILGQDFTVQFKLKETAGAPITYEKISIAILQSDGTHLFDLETYDNITISANNTWSQSATDQIYLNSEAGNYKAVIRGKVSGGEWFDFQTVDSGVNPTTFSAVKPTTESPSGEISLDTSVDGQTATTASGSPVTLLVSGSLPDIHKVYVNSVEQFSTATAYDFSNPATSTLEYTVSGTGTKTLYAWFEDEVGNRSDAVSLSFTISAHQFTLSYTAGLGGSITGEATQMVDPESDGTAAEAVPDEGYHFVQWSDGATLNPRKDENVTGNITVTALFAKDNIDYVYTNFNGIGNVYTTFELESNDFKATFHEVRVGEVYNADPEEDFVLYPPYALSMSNYYEGYSGPTKISFSKPATFVRGHVRGAWFESGWFEAEAYVTAWDEEDKLIDTYAVPNNFHGVFEFRGQIARIELLNSHSNDTVAVLNDFYAESDSNITNYPVLGVSPENQSVSEHPGSISFGVSNTGNGTLVWSAAIVSGDDWISITDGSSGTDAGTITCEYEANTGPSPRTAVIRITATDGSGSPMDVTVTQSAIISFDMNEPFDALRVISGQVADIDLDKDINADGKIGISEAIYSLQNASDTNEKNYHCGAYVAPGVWKEFDCYNLAAIGKVTKDDPFTPSWRLIGGYWQWGQKGPDPSQRYNTNAAKFAHGPIGPGSNEANHASISGWDSYDAPDDTWSDSYKTDSDPCPIGFRVPTKAQWQGVLDNNTLSTVGTWSTMWDDHNNYSSARFFGSDLMLPAAGLRNGYGGALRDRGRSGSYWSSSQYSSSHAWYPYFGSGHVGTTNSYRRIGRSVRCVAE